LAPAIASIKELIAKALAVPGVSEILKPAADQLATKLDALIKA
jgi:hypothetical protein